MITFFLWTLVGAALVGAAIDWAPHFHNLGRVRVLLASRKGRLWFIGRHMNFSVTAGVPKTVFLVSVPAGAKVTDIAYAYDDNGSNVGSFHPADDGMSGVFLGTGAGSATVTVNCKSVGGVALSNASTFTIAAAPPVEATAVELRDAP